MLIDVLGRDIEFEGNVTDPYFKSLDTHAKGFSDLVALARLVPDDAVIFDVGANIGLSAAYLAVARPAARIFAFEPSPANLTYLRQNVSPFANVTIVEAAASNKPGSIGFHVAGFGAGSHVVGASHVRPGTATTAVPTLTLDNYAAEHDLHPALIKLDVEGHEPEALAGARHLLEADRPWVHMEFNTFTLNAFAGHSPAAFATALWKAFDVEIAGVPQPNGFAFLHDHFVKNHCMADLVLKPKAGAPMPSLEEMSFSPAARQAIIAAVS